MTSALSLVNGLQPSKHENGFSSSKEPGRQEHLASPGLSMAGEPILPFSNKEPFLTKAVAKAPQVTGERPPLLRPCRCLCNLGPV